MSKLLRGAVAGAGAWKLGGGFIGTVLLFILLWVVLGNFDIFKFSSSPGPWWPRVAAFAATSGEAPRSTEEPARQ